MQIFGARWWKFDFHTHSPASFDYSPSDPSLKSSITPKQWLMGYVNMGIECVAITDHNTGAWIDKLKEAANELREEKINITVFPGVEITANGNVHILAIFDPSKTSSDIQAVLGASGFHGTWGNSDSVAEDSPEIVIEKIKKFGGLAIPAHIDMKAGMCTQISSAITLKQICKKASAVEIVFPEAVAGQQSFDILKTYRSLNTCLPEVIGSDAHHPSKIGRAFTWVKMSSPTLDGVRLALLDGSSIRPFNTAADPNSRSDTLLISLQVENAQYCGRNKPFILNFNPWLNSVIGSRGSGKSSILEFIRVGMGRDKDIYKLPPSNEIRASFERFAQIPLNREADGVFRTDMKINCVMFKHGAYYNLSWAVQAPNIVISKWNGTEWVVEPGDASARFPLKIFSQKQIFDLAKNPSSLLNLIDSSPQVDKTSWDMRWAEQKNLYLRLSTQARELSGRLQNRAILSGQLADLNQKISIIEDSQHAVVLQNFQQAESKRSSLNRFMDETDLALKKLLQATTVSFPALDEVAFSKDAPDLEVIEKSKALTKELNAQREQIIQLITYSNLKLKAHNTWVASSQALNSIAGAELQYASLVSQLAQSGVSNPSEYKELITSRDDLLKKIDELDSVELLKQNLTTEVNKSYADLCALRKELTELRMRFIADNVNNNPALQLGIEALASTSEIDSTFRAVIGKQDSTFSSDIYEPEKSQGILYQLSQKLNLTQSSTSSDTDIDARLLIVHNFKSETLNIKTSQLAEWVGKRFSDYIVALPATSHDLLNCWFPEDLLTVKYSDGHRFKDISQGSAGQKAATILSFLLSYGDEPLILDQPEDDLDNGLISSLIVTRLQQNKARRQIIVVTHNPNIVVNGDSEYVIALEDKGQIQVSACGSLQDLDVRKQVCEIMEGGEIALSQRYNRMVNI